MLRARFYRSGRLVGRVVAENITAADFPTEASCAVILRPNDVPLVVHRTIYPGETLFAGGGSSVSRARAMLRSHRASGC